jgi:hypothetical protein
MAEEKSVSQIWYTRRGEEVKGPYPIGQIRRYVLLGRIRETDEVSPDGEVWQSVKETPVVVPDEMKHLETPEDFRRLERARLREDERLDPDRRQDAELPEPKDLERRRSDRRQEEDMEVVQHRLAKADLIQEMRSNKPSYRWQILVTVLLVVGVSVGYFIAQPPATVAERECTSPPHSGINWESCQLNGSDYEGADLRGAAARNVDLARSRLRFGRLAGSDLSYGIFTEADLTGADLSQALLVGANLRGAVLAGADLTGADLSYADLTGADLSDVHLEGARLGKAVWPDRTVCAVGSVGGCGVQ